MEQSLEYQDYISKLSDDELVALFEHLKQLISDTIQPQTLSIDFKENRFKDGFICVHCNSNRVVKNGHANGKQRYKCMDCNRQFNDLTRSPLSYTKLSLKKWENYAQYMLDGFSIRKVAIKISVCIKTSFYMRHKILNCIKEYIGIGTVQGIVEVDETFHAVSYKGNHSKSDFTMPRASRSRGGEVKKRGISKDQVCIVTAIDRNKDIILAPVCTGRVGNNQLKALFSGRIKEGSILCTDSHTSYPSLARELHLKHKQIKSGKHKEDIYHINHVNSLHSRYKNWIRKFNGVSTKFLENYLYWFKWLELFKNETEAVRGRNLLIHSVVPFVDVRIETYKQRQASFL